MQGTYYGESFRRGVPARFRGANAPGVAERKQGGNWKMVWGEGSRVKRSVSRPAPFLEGKGTPPPPRPEGLGCVEGDWDPAPTPVLGGQRQVVARQ